MRLEKFDGEKMIKIIVPLHSEMKKGTLNRIIKDAGLSQEEFAELK